MDAGGLGIPLANAWAGLLGEDFDVEEVGFDGPHAANAPAGRDHLLDDVIFSGGGGLMDADELIEILFEFVWVFAIEEDIASAGGEAVFQGIA
jgi:hypothetical protein